MATLNENFDSFLAECRCIALEKIKADEKFIFLKKKGDSLLSEIESSMTQDIKAVFEEYMEITTAIQAIQLDTVYLSGAMDLFKISKQYGLL